MKKVWAVRKDSEAVSPVIATILMVAITVVLAAVLYVMVLGFGGTQQTTPTAGYSKKTITNGVQITIVSFPKNDVPWDDVKIQVSDGSNIAEWSPTKANQMTTTAHNYSTSTALTGLTICCEVTDVGANGFVSGTDHFQLFTFGGAPTFASGTQYTAVLLYEPTGEQCGQPQTFTG